jgi:hypothetical protein
MKKFTDVIVDKETMKVIAININNEWITAKGFGVVHFENGVEPMFIDVDGELYLKPNTIVVTDY